MSNKPNFVHQLEGRSKKRINRSIRKKEKENTPPEKPKLKLCDHIRKFFKNLMFPHNHT